MVKIIATIDPPAGGRYTARSQPPMKTGFDYDVVTMVYQASVGTVTQETVDDKVYDKTEGGVLAQEYRINISIWPTSGEISSVTYVSSNPAVGEIVDTHHVRYVSDGSVNVTVTLTSVLGGVFVAVIPLTFVGTAEATTWELIGADPGSVREDAIDAIDDALVGKDAGDKLIYSTQDHTTPNYVRDSGCWASGLDLTCISPWNSNSTYRKAGTLITPRHIIFAAHYEIASGSTIRFIAADNTIHTRTITHKKRHPSYSPYYPDLTVGILDSDVPVGINFCKVLPTGWETYLPTNIDDIPCLVIDKQEKALVADGQVIQSSLTSFTYPTDAQRLVFSEALISGDSGNPAFLIINGELVLLTVWTYGGPGSGTSITTKKTDIDSMIADVDALASVSTGYTVTPINLAVFNSY